MKKRIAQNIKAIQFETYMMPEILAELMEKHNIKVKTLATAIGSHSNTINQYLDGTNQPTLKIVMRLAIFFNVSLDYLVYGKE